MRLYDAAKAVQQAAAAKETADWVEESLNQYELFGKEADLVEWITSYVYRHTCKESFAEEIAYRVVVKLREENRGNKKIEEPVVVKEEVPVAPVMRTLKELRGLQGGTPGPKEKFVVQYQRGETNLTGKKTFIGKSSGAVKSHFLSKYKSKVLKVDSLGQV